MVFLCLLQNKVVYCVHIICLLHAHLLVACLLNLYYLFIACLLTKRLKLSKLACLRLVKWNDTPTHAFMNVLFPTTKRMGQFGFNFMHLSTWVTLPDQFQPLASQTFNIFFFNYCTSAPTLNWQVSSKLFSGPVNSAAVINHCYKEKVTHIAEADVTKVFKDLS